MIRRKDILRVGIERVSVPTPWVTLGTGKYLTVTLSAKHLEIGSHAVPGHHWIRTGVTFSPTFEPKYGRCNHWLYRGIVHRSALGFGCGGAYLMRMPKKSHPGG